MAAADRTILKPLPNEGTRGFRLEIDEFLADNEMANLFLIALSDMQKDPLKQIKDKKGTLTTDWLSFYSLASIHASPYENWDGVPNEPRPTSDPNRPDWGYCQHGTNLFPTWHRPYMMLYETAIHSKMVEWANKFENSATKAKYLEAAARFRLPYWDIVMPRRVPDVKNGEKIDTMWTLPDILKTRKVFVKYPSDDDDDAKFTEINNPLYSFVFPTKKDFQGHPEREKLEVPNGYSSVQTTRHASFDSVDATDAASLKASADSLDKSIRRNTKSQAVQIFQALSPNYEQQSKDKKATIFINQKRSWWSFANHRVREEVIDSHAYATISLESLHDSIHRIVGGAIDLSQPNYIRSGHMGIPSVAAFDPIFWLHHNNIDRLLSIYQALNPDRYVGPNEIDLPLKPFEKEVKNGKKTFYTSGDDIVKSYWAPGFALPGDKKLEGADQDALARKLQAYLTDTYYWAQYPNEQISPKPLVDWPKNLNGSWALKGSKAEPTPKFFHMTALKVERGIPTLVAVAAPVHPEAAETQETVIKTASVLEKVEKVDANLPGGALEKPPAEKASAKSLSWNAHVKVKKFAFNGPFSIDLFIGKVDDNDPGSFLTKKNEAGFTHVFANKTDAGCANCKKQSEEDFIYGDVIPLTVPLYDHLNAVDGRLTEGQKRTIENLEPSEVVPFLKEHLRWRITSVDEGLITGREQEAGLEITVTSREFESPSNDHVAGVYGPPEAYPDITSAKPGGFGYVYAN